MRGKFSWAKSLKWLKHVSPHLPSSPCCFYSCLSVHLVISSASSQSICQMLRCFRLNHPWSFTGSVSSVDLVELILDLPVVSCLHVDPVVHSALSRLMTSYRICQTVAYGGHEASQRSYTPPWSVMRSDRVGGWSRGQRGPCVCSVNSVSLISVRSNRKTTTTEYWLMSNCLMFDQ